METVKGSERPWYSLIMMETPAEAIAIANEIIAAHPDEHYSDLRVRLETAGVWDFDTTEPVLARARSGCGYACEDGECGVTSKK